MAPASNNRPEMLLRRPLPAGAPIVYWQLGATQESGYDVADRPMNGDMDPFFFLTKHKNFIPHEYPCRTEFAAERRDRRPAPQGHFESVRNWLPFSSPRVDLSGFWFRPTVLGTWARTVIEAQASGAATLRLRTCGGAVLLVNGEEAGWMAPYRRNLETEAEFAVQLNRGENDIGVWFDDLAERDARYYFQLDYVAGPKAEQALPVPADPATADAMEAALETMHFERPAYTGGEVALAVDLPLPADAEVEIRIEGDFMSIEPAIILRRKLPAGAKRIAIADAEELPADFRHFKVTLATGGFAASRVFGVEICHADRQGEAPTSLRLRIDEALHEVSDHAEADTVRALARLAIGKGGVETDAMIAAALPPIEDCHDCADFILVPLLWCRKAFAADIASALRERIDQAILNYRYWMDEPGNDVQWYFSENHALLFHTAAYLAGDILSAERFARSGRTGAEQSAVGAARVRAWLNHFEQWEMAEFNSAPYFPIDLKGLCILQALAPDADISRRAGAAVLRILEIVARSAHHGFLTGAQGRSYEHTLRASRSLELSGIARMLWGEGYYGTRFHALPQLALCLRDHGLAVPAELVAVASVPNDSAWEWTFAQGQGGFAKLYHYKTREFALGSAAAYRWNEWGYQENVLHLRMGRNPDAQIWINHPGEVMQSGYGRPSYWGGSGTLPRVQQYRALAVVAFDCAAEQPDFTHAWFPAVAFDRSSVEGNIALAQCDDAFVMLKTDGQFRPVASGPTANCEIRVGGHRSLWLVRAGDVRTSKSLASFRERFESLDVRHGVDGELMVDDPQYGTVRFFADGRIAAEGRLLDPSKWTVCGKAVDLARSHERADHVA